MLGDSLPTTRSAGTTTCWPQGRASRSTTTHESTDDPKDIEYRIKARIDETQQGRSAGSDGTLDETYNRRSGVRQINDAVRDCGLRHVRA